MNRFKEFSGGHPIQFSLLITFLVLLFYIVAAVLAELLSNTVVGYNLTEALGRLLGSAIFVFLLWRFGWQEDAGLMRFGSLTVWLAAIIILAYEVATHVYPFLRGSELSNINPTETAAVALNAVTTGPLEEIPFRGIIFYAFLRLWAGSTNGLVKSLLLSALLFGGSHLIHILLGRPIPQAMLVALNAMLAGIYYAAIVLRWKTIWPPIFLHSGVNVFAAIVAFNIPGFSEPVPALLLAVAFQIPIVIWAGYLISRIKPVRVAAAM